MGLLWIIYRATRGVRFRFFAVLCCFLILSLSRTSYELMKDPIWLKYLRYGDDYVPDIYGGDFVFRNKRSPNNSENSSVSNSSVHDRRASFPTGSDSLFCKAVPVRERFDCLPVSYRVNQKLCQNIGCCWSSSKAKHTKGPPVPSCYFPQGFVGYQVKDAKYWPTGLAAVLQRAKPSGLPKDVGKLKFDATYIDSEVLRIKITNFDAPRYEVPLPLFIETNITERTPLNYDISLSKDGVFQVIRKSSKETLLSMNLPTLLYADQVLQLSSSIPSHYIYGLGDHMGPLRRNTYWTKYTFFNRDEIPKVNKNLYSSFPFYLVMEKDGNSHGVFLFNSNAMDIILQPMPAVTFRTTGGIFDFFVFLGPTPSGVVRKFTKVIGYPAMPPYWSLGFHLCRLGYMSINKTAQVWKRTMEANIPFDTQWNDIDYMHNYNDFTFDKEEFSWLPDFVKNLHGIGMHYVMIVDPGISNAESPGSYPPYDDGLRMNVFIRNSSGKFLTTKVWNKVSSVFPDFTNPISQKYWMRQLSDFHSKVPFDGVWLDMNEPTNFLNGSYYGCPSSSALEHPPYVPGGDPLITKTICMTAQHNISTHYNVHNIYGTMQTKLTYRALTDIRRKRPFIVSRAGFPGIGRYSAMWNGDVRSTWEHMQATIPSILSFSMSGIPMVGADICGFNDNTSVELCARWSALGAFYPFCRNHNSDDTIEQDPVALGPIVISSAKTSLSIRYFLLPYLYTLFYLSHTRGDTVARPLFFEFPFDVHSYRIDRQFLWGPALLIIPALKPSVKTVQGYLPHGIWYNFYSGEMFNSTGRKYAFAAPLDRINLAVRGGYILPCQIPNVTTTASRKNRFVFIAALNNELSSSGELYWDDGDSLDVDETKKYNFINFSVKKNKFQSSVIHHGYHTVMELEGLHVFGVKDRPRIVLLNGEIAVYEYDERDKVLHVLHLYVTLLKPVTIVWL